MGIDRSLDRPGLELNTPRGLGDSPFGLSGPITPAPVGVAKTTIEATGATSLTAAMPDDIVAGELLVVVCGGDYAASGALFSTATTGWTLQLTQGNSTSDCYQGIFWKEAVGADADLVIDSNLSQRMVSIAFRVENADTTNPFMSQFNYTGSASRWGEELYAPRQIETHCMLLGSVSMDGSNRAPVNPSTYAQSNGWASLADIQSNPATTTGVGLSVSTCPSEELDEEVFMPVSKWGVLTKTLTDSAMVVTAIIRAVGVDSSQTNLINYSRDLSLKTLDISMAEMWYASSAATATFDQPGIGGVANTATRLLDNNGSQKNYVTFNFDTHNTWDAKRCVVRYIIKKEPGGATAVPYLQIRAQTGPGFTSGLALSVQIETELGTLFETADDLANGSYAIQEFPGDSDFWEVVMQADVPTRYPTATMYPDLGLSYGGGESAAQVLGFDLGSVEMYLNCDKEDVFGKPARLRDPENDMQTGAYLVYDPHMGTGNVAITGQKPPVRVAASDVWISPGSGLDGIYNQYHGMLRTANFTDWTVVNAGQPNIKVHQRFNSIWTAGTNAWLGVRFDATGSNGWMVGINNVLVNPTLVIQRVVADAFEAAVVTEATGHAAHRDSFDLTVTADAAGIYASLFIGNTETEYTAELIDTEYNDQEHAAIGMYATGGVNYVLAVGPFSVESY